MAWWKVVLYTLGFIGVFVVLVGAGLLIGAIVGAFYVPIVILSIIKDSGRDVIKVDEI